MREKQSLILIFLCFSLVSAFTDVQRQFTDLIGNSLESCETVISMCEKPFIGFEIKKECSGVDFSERCKFASCNSELCNLFEIGIQKCHTLCKLGPMNDDCRNCAYLPQGRDIPKMGQTDGFKSASELISGNC